MSLSRVIQASHTEPENRKVIWLDLRDRNNLIFRMYNTGMWEGISEYDLSKYVTVSYLNTVLRDYLRVDSKIPAINVAGHKSVDTFDDLLSIEDNILSFDLNQSNDAIGQLWYVSYEDIYYKLVSWENRNLPEGWVEYSVSGGGEGTPGVGIDNIINYYLISNSLDVTHDTEGWNTVVLTTSKEFPYLWNYESIIYSDGSIQKTDPAIISNFAEDGNGIIKFEDWFAVTNNTATPGKELFTTDVLKPTNTTKYLWTYQKIYYTNNTIQDTDIRIAAVYGDSGEQGVGIKEVINYYLASTAREGITTETPGWTIEVQNPTEEKQWLWNYEEIVLQDNTSTTSPPTIIGNYSRGGDQGLDGDRIISITDYYAVNNSSSVAPEEDSFTTEVVSPTSENKYLWIYEIILYTVYGEYKTDKRVAAVHGNTGNDGNDGKDIEFIFKLHNQSTLTTIPSSENIDNFIPEGWSDNQPSATETNKYVFSSKRIKVNGVWGSFNTPALWAIYTTNGEDGIDGKDVEFIFKTTDTNAVPTPKPSSLQIDDWHPEDWSDNPTGVDEVYKWEWVCKRTKTNNVWSEFSNPTLWAKYSEDGTPGTDGTSISEIINYYLATNASSGVKNTDQGWTTAIQNPSTTKLYLWNYEEIKLDNNTSTKTEPTIIGNYSKGGEQGLDGDQIVRIVEYYAISDDGINAPPLSSFGEDIVSPTAELKYLWIYEIITYTIYGDWTSNRRVAAVYGDIGLPGADGNGVEFIFINSPLASPPDAPPTSQEDDYVPTHLGWSDNPVGVNEVNKFEYVSKRSKINSAWSNFSTPTLWTKYTENGEPGKDGDSIQYIYKLYATEEIPSRPSSSYILDGWSDDPLNVGESFPYEYISQRTKVNNIWSTFSVPTLWAKYSFNGSPGDPGADADTIVSAYKMYYLSNEKLQLIGGTWSLEYPEYSLALADKYLFFREFYVFESGNESDGTTPILDGAWLAAQQVDGKYNYLADNLIQQEINEVRGLSLAKIMAVSPVSGEQTSVDFTRSIQSFMSGIVNDNVAFGATNKDIRNLLNVLINTPTDDYDTSPGSNYDTQLSNAISGYQTMLYYAPLCNMFSTNELVPYGNSDLEQYITYGILQFTSSAIWIYNELIGWGLDIPTISHKEVEDLQYIVETEYAAYANDAITAQQYKEYLLRDFKAVQGDSTLNDYSEGIFYSDAYNTCVNYINWFYSERLTPEPPRPNFLVSNKGELFVNVGYFKNIVLEDSTIYNTNILNSNIENANIENAETKNIQIENQYVKGTIKRYYDEVNVSIGVDGNKISKFIMPSRTSGVNPSSISYAIMPPLEEYLELEIIFLPDQKNRSEYGYLGLSTGLSIIINDVTDLGYEKVMSLTAKSYIDSNGITRDHAKKRGVIKMISKYNESLESINDTGLYWQIVEISDSIELDITEILF